MAFLLMRGEHFLLFQENLLTLIINKSKSKTDILLTQRLILNYET
jgi:hypothetical protein